ncbi:hypothetical protein Scep_001551 [Stephania cephalantha]|uniref:Uncharacterized protein n=1 Tax=Stephania cephalantha TaxID=152367 RepID=A0AAP0Q3V9_9MAGN
MGGWSQHVSRLACGQRRAACCAGGSLGNKASSESVRRRQRDTWQSGEMLVGHNLVRRAVAGTWRRQLTSGHVSGMKTGRVKAWAAGERTSVQMEQAWLGAGGSLAAGWSTEEQQTDVTSGRDRQSSRKRHLVRCNRWAEFVSDASDDWRDR